MPEPRNLVIECLNESTGLFRHQARTLGVPPSEVDDVIGDFALAVVRRRLHERYNPTLAQPVTFLSACFATFARAAVRSRAQQPHRRHAQLHPEMTSTHADPSDRVRTAERIDVYKRAIRAMSPSERAAVEALLKTQGDHKTAAARLGINRDTLRQRLVSGRRRTSYMMKLLD